MRKAWFFAEAKNAPSSGSKEAEESCRILEEYGIDLNSASNGVFLPYIKNNFVTTEAMHCGGHLDSYHDKVERMILEQVKIGKNLGYSKLKIQKLICNELQEIRIELLKGIIKIHN